jgi:uncharacterized protein (TIGR02246 family)
MDEDIHDLWRTMADGWNSGDAYQFAGVFAEDVDFVTVRGEPLSGRKAVETMHAKLFTTSYQDTWLTTRIQLIRPLGEAIRLVHVTSAIRPLGLETHAQAVVVGSVIAAFHNMIPYVAQGRTP